jgi:hypothetical protein
MEQQKHECVQREAGIKLALRTAAMSLVFMWNYCMHFQPYQVIGGCEFRLF